MEDFIIYTTITTFKEKWELTALLNHSTYTHPSLSNKEINFFADNDIWILKDLLVNLKELVEASKLNISASQTAINFKIEELSSIKINDYQTIIDLIEKGIELGFFKHEETK
jgi:hypothetical protein